MPTSIHLHPAAPLAERVLLPGDPGRALLLAQVLLEQPRMFNHNRGLWGYTGTASDGQPLTIQSTGMGGPSAAIVVHELAQLGARRLIRVGTCGALDPSLSLGDVVIASEALAGDGTSRALAGADRLAPSPQLYAALTAAANGSAYRGIVVSTDLFYGDSDRRSFQPGTIAVEMETATLFAIAHRREELEAASLLIVTDLLIGERVRIEPDQLRAAEHRLGEIAFTAIRS